jgi:hypothetical protein
MLDDRVPRIHEELAEVLKRFDAEHLVNLGRGVSGPDLLRHITNDVERLRALTAKVESLESEHVTMGVSLLNAELRKSVRDVDVSVEEPAETHHRHKAKGK